ncbi:HAD-IIIC family phosphatase [Streptomyces sp. NPDC050388]|uniref:HAD-IIIC family phosphatase n=1 Tax=Streptomyces sp. NPDC050388 TaxID=3155781 RepID=UPI003421CF29
MNRSRTAPQVKVVVWDLDNTLWDGALVEGADGTPRPSVVRIIQELDGRGVLQSVASKNDAAVAMPVLEAAGLAEFFLYPEISWSPKSDAVKHIAAALNVGTDTVLFVDDDPFERAEVAASHPEVRCVDSRDVHTLLTRDDIPAPDAVPADSVSRRELYRREERRQADERVFTGTKSEFLASLHLRLAIRDARPEDLTRAAELTTRTNQLNTTGLAFGQRELSALTTDPGHSVLVLELEDDFGEYGMIGVVVVRHTDDEMRVRLFLLSCRVMGRNLVPAIVAELADAARARGVALTADFVSTPVNRPMYVTYRFAGFREQDERDGVKNLALAGSPSEAATAHVRITDRPVTLGTTKGSHQ